MFDSRFKSLMDLQKAFPTEQDCINYLEGMRWQGKVVSPFDPTSKVYKCKDNKYRCKNTGKYFNVKTKLIFHKTAMPLIKWFMAIWLVLVHKKGISSVQLSKDIGVTQKTAWFMLHRIRKALGLDNDVAINEDDGDEKLNGTGEVDETFIGGKNKNRHADKKVNALNNNGMEEYIRKIFIAPNAAIKVACFKAGMTEEDYYNTLGECRMYGDNKEKNEEYQRELCRKIFRPTPEEEEEDINRWKEDGAKVMSFEDCVTLVLEGLPVKTKKDDILEM